jgi:stage II sporulation protein D
LFVNNINIRYVIVALVFFVFPIALLFSCLNISKKKEITFIYDKYLEKPPDVRVLLLENAEKAKIEINSSYVIRRLDNNKILTQGTYLPDSAISVNSGRFQIKPVSSHSTPKISAPFIEVDGKIEITTQNGGFIRLNNSKYQGKLLMIPQKAGRFSVLEEINVEDYLPGVIGSEMPAKWPDDAIIAQVIAARTYAVYQKKNNLNAQYHINKLDLAYNGSYKSLPRLTEIVNKSRGIIMVYDWGIFPGYFHSTCGGHTEDVSLVFDLKSIRPLSGARCGYCSKSKYYRWKEVIKKGEIEERLRNSSINVKEVNGITAEGIGPGGHCSTIKVKYSKGEKRINANEFRLMIGPNYLLSTAFKIKDSGNSLIFEGKGWGHGVGLCQYGTQDMAESGFKWFEILKHYYPGTEFVKIY